MMKKHNSYALTLIGLHLLLAVYSLSAYFRKIAAAQRFVSWQILALNCGKMADLLL